MPPVRLTAVHAEAWSLATAGPRQSTSCSGRAITPIRDSPSHRR